MDAVAALSARPPQEGFISVIAGFSFLGIVLGVATLIIVMAVMNGFRQELLGKILGLNGHILVQPLERPLTDYKEVAERIGKLNGVRMAVPSSKARRSPHPPIMRRACWCAASAKRTCASCRPSPTISARARWEGFDQGQGVAIGKRLADQLSLHAGDNITLVAPRGAVTPMGTSPRIKVYKVAAIFEIGNVGI